MIVVSQGFQLVLCKDSSADPKKKVNSIVMGSSKQPDSEPFIEMRLSIGRILHIITLCGSEIHVTRYRPR